jgi:hypothetical protein
MYVRATCGCVVTSEFKTSTLWESPDKANDCAHANGRRKVKTTNAVKEKINRRIVMLRSGSLFVLSSSQLHCFSTTSLSASSPVRFVPKSEHSQFSVQKTRSGFEPSGARSRVSGFGPFGTLGTFGSFGKIPKFARSAGVSFPFLIFGAAITPLLSFQLLLASAPVPQTATGSESSLFSDLP